MTQYDSYKDSGEDWLGLIPSHWSTSKVAYLFGGTGSGTTPDTSTCSYYSDCGINWLQTGDLNDGVISSTSKKITQKALDDYSALRMYPAGSLAVAMYGATIGKVGLLNIESTTNQACCVLLPSSNINMRFAYYCFLASKNVLVTLASGGGQPNISQGIIRAHRLPLLPLSEQSQIASWLDWKIGQIDDIIAEKESIVADMQKYRQSLISETVTHGLNSNEPLRSSGIDLIGDIPESWNCLKLKRILSDESDNLKVGPFGSQLQGDDILREGDYWIYNQRTVLDNNFETTNAYVSKDKFENMSSFAVREKDILITTRGTIGKICQVPNNHAKGIIHPCIIKFRINEEMMDYKFLEFVFNDSNIVEQQIKISSNATTIDVIYGGTLKEIFLPVPTVKEQKEIVQFLASKTEQIDEIISGLTVQITDLRSYKSSLISEAVTGKIDLREVEIPETIKA